MANIKSAKKRINVISKKTLINKSRKSALKTAEKKYLAAVESGNKEEAAELFKVMQKMLASAGSSSTMHKKAASRKTARLNKKLNLMA
jgi:small subunit ribosomal protein S20